MTKSSNTPGSSRRQQEVNNKHSEKKSTSINALDSASSTLNKRNKSSSSNKSHNNMRNSSYQSYQSSPVSLLSQLRDHHQWFLRPNEEKWKQKPCWSEVSCSSLKSIEQDCYNHKKQLLKQLIDQGCYQSVNKSTTKGEESVCTSDNTSSWVLPSIIEAKSNGFLCPFSHLNSNEYRIEWFNRKCIDADGESVDEQRIIHLPSLDEEILLHEARLKSAQSLKRIASGNLNSSTLDSNHKRIKFMPKQKVKGETNFTAPSVLKEKFPSLFRAIMKHSIVNKQTVKFDDYNWDMFSSNSNESNQVKQQKTESSDAQNDRAVERSDKVQMADQTVGEEKRLNRSEDVSTVSVQAYDRGNAEIQTEAPYCETKASSPGQFSELLNVDIDLSKLSTSTAKASDSSVDLDTTFQSLPSKDPLSDNFQLLQHQINSAINNERERQEKIQNIIPSEEFTSSHCSMIVCDEPKGLLYVNPHREKTKNEIQDLERDEMERIPVHSGVDKKVELYMEEMKEKLVQRIIRIVSSDILSEILCKQVSQGTPREKEVSVPCLDPVKYGQLRGAILTPELVQYCISEGIPLNSSIINDIISDVMESIMRSILSNEHSLSTEVHMVAKELDSEDTHSYSTINFEIERLLLMMTLMEMSHQPKFPTEQREVNFVSDSGTQTGHEVKDSDVIVQTDRAVQNEAIMMESSCFQTEEKDTHAIYTQTSVEVSKVHTRAEKGNQQLNEQLEDVRSGDTIINTFTQTKERKVYPMHTQTSAENCSVHIQTESIPVPATVRDKLSPSPTKLQFEERGEEEKSDVQVRDTSSREDEGSIFEQADEDYNYSSGGTLFPLLQESEIERRLRQEMLNRLHENNRLQRSQSSDSMDSFSSTGSSISIGSNSSFSETMSVQSSLDTMSTFSSSFFSGRAILSLSEVSDIEVATTPTSSTSLSISMTTDS